MFAARRVTKLFGRVPVLRELELELEPGRCHVIFGRNGAGKSTLLQVAATLFPSSSPLPKRRASYSTSPRSPDPEAG